jgi:hypothetical protein
MSKKSICSVLYFLIRQYSVLRKAKVSLSLLRVRPRVQLSVYRVYIVYSLVQMYSVECIYVVQHWVCLSMNMQTFLVVLAE